MGFFAVSFVGHQLCDACIKCFETITKAIKAAATKGETEVIVREVPYSNWLWQVGAHGLDSEIKQVIDELTANGFKVSHHYRSDSYFADFGLKISWGKQ